MAEITAARLRDLAARAEALAAAITATKADFRAVSGDYQHPVRRAGFRLDEAAGEARNVRDELLLTAADLDRIASRPEGSCGIPWGVCPDHGNTLASSGGKTWCQLPDCKNRWDYDRMGLPCAEPARWKVADARGASGPMCDGHAMDARKRLEGATVEPLGGGTATVKPSDFAVSLTSRARWARDHNDGHPDAAWSTGEVLIVALILGDQATLDGMNYTRQEVESRLMGDLRYYGYEGDAAAWLDEIRKELARDA